jgi:hypothetical protein
MALSVLVAASLSALGCAVNATDVEPEPVGMAAQAEVKSTAFDVDFRGCMEIASIATVDYAAARPLVPAQYALAGDGSTVALAVVRAVHCDGVSIDGGKEKPGNLAQIGITLVPPEGTGDINNYTLWYYTTSGKLASKLQSNGIPAQLVEDLSFSLQQSALHIEVPSSGYPRFVIDSPVVEPAPSPVLFTANWYTVGEHGKSSKMATSLPDIEFGGASMTLRTKAAGPLGQLLGTGTATSFPVLNSFNRFQNAHMHVDLFP